MKFLLKKSWFVPSFFLYIARLYARNLVIVFSALWIIVYLFDTVELMRRAEGKDNITIGLLLEMGLLKLPEVGQALMPFVVLVGAMFTLWNLARNSELTVMRGVGLSPWQMLAPMVGIVLLLGSLQITVVNPLGAAFISKFERLENKYLKRQTSQIAMFEHGMWLLQEMDSGGYVILHSDKVLESGKKISGVTALEFNPDDSQKLRVDAQNGVLKPNQWVLKNPVINYPSEELGKQQEEADYWSFPTNLTPVDIARSFADDGGMAFWSLPNHIKILEETGFDASSLRVHFHHLMAAPIIFVAMVFLAAALFVRPARGKSAMIASGIGLASGLGVFFFVQFSEALGVSGQLSPALSAWAPAMASLLMAGGLVLQLEEG